MSACEELVGRPRYQVIRFHIIAPKSPPSTTIGVTTLISIRPLPMVFATAVPKTKNAMKLKNAAHTTACRGERTRVETIVAMELAASCTPLVKSKIRATATIPMTRRSDEVIMPRLRRLDRDALNNIADLLILVQNMLQALQHIFHFYDPNGVQLFRE